MLHTDKKRFSGKKTIRDSHIKNPKWILFLIKAWEQCSKIFWNEAEVGKQ